MYPAFKRGFDMLAALSGLCLLIPLLLYIAGRIYLGDGAPLFYRETRLGRGERPFSLLKFRTLRNHDPAPHTLAIEGDPRITRTGVWLRRWRLDEFPALINVLTGEMSLVGPRPMVAEHAAVLTEEERQAIYSVRPGLTDTAAVAFLAEDAVLAEVADPETAYFEKIFHPKMRTAVHGVERASFTGDLGILLTTLRQLWSRRARKQSEALVRALLQRDA